jgi:hypothetical protein
MSSLDAFLHHPIETLERALHIRKQIDQLNGVLRELFGPTPVSLAGVQTNAPRKRGRPRKMNVIAAEVLNSGAAMDEWSPGAEVAKAKKKKKRKMSAEARERIAAAQRARWAKQKGASGPAKAAAKPKPKAATAKPARTKKISAPRRAARAKAHSAKKGASDKARKQIAEAGQPKFKIL